MERLFNYNPEGSKAIGAFEVVFLFYLLMRLNNRTWISGDSKDEVTLGSIFLYSLSLPLSSVDQAFITLDVILEKQLLFRYLLLKELSKYCLALHNWSNTCVSLPAAHIFRYFYFIHL